MWAQARQYDAPIGKAVPSSGEVVEDVSTIQGSGLSLKETFEVPFS
jgi:hypothetical protein